MGTEFDDVMRQRTDAELVEILNRPEGDYQPSAVESAKREFERRNLTREQIGTIKSDLEQRDQQIALKANEPLGGGWKALAFIFPGIMNIAFAGPLLVEGYDKKYRDFVRWTIYGAIFYGSIVAIIILSMVRWPEI